MLYTKTMNFRYLSISHHTAPVSRRERFHLDEAEKQRLTDALRKSCPDLNALLILVTCNRTELYFETAQTRAVQVRDFFLNWKLGEIRSEDQVDGKVLESRFKGIFNAGFRFRGLVRPVHKTEVTVKKRLYANA